MKNFRLCLSLKKKKENLLSEIYCYTIVPFLKMNVYYNYCAY